MQRIYRVILISLLLLTASGVFIWKIYSKQEIQTISSALTAEELLKYTVELEEITTNLHGKGYVQIKFQLQADSSKAKDELQYRSMQIRHIIIQTIASKSIDEIKGEEGIVAVEQSIKNQINEIMNTGQVLKIFSTKMLMQN